MKHLFFSVILFLAFISASAQSWFNVGSYNIRYDSSSDKAKGNGWEVRSQELFDLVNYERWEIFGAQEVLHNQLEDLLAGLDNYDYIGVGRNDGDKKGEYAPIFYRKDRMRCLDKGWFWISETPDVVASKGWDADQCRICTWGRFEDKTTKWKFWLFNVHLDHRGVTARREGYKLILSKIKEMCGDEPYILTGDFNVKPDNACLVDLDKIMTSTRKIAEKTDNKATFNGWGRAAKDSVIDYIYVSGFSQVQEYETITKKYAERPFISDHFPIISTVVF